MAEKKNTDKKMTEKKNIDIMQKDIKEMFELFDKDKNGFISYNELKLGLQTVGNPTEAEIKGIYKQMGLKPDGKIKIDQFSECIKNFYYNTDPTSEKDALKRSFKHFDKDNNGTLDIKELRLALSSVGEKLTDKELDELFRAVDTNKDGKIKSEEFVKMFTNFKNM